MLLPPSKSCIVRDVVSHLHPWYSLTASSKILLMLYHSSQTKVIHPFISIGTQFVISFLKWKAFFTHRFLAPPSRRCGEISHRINPDSKVHGANMGPTWVIGSCRPQTGPMLAPWTLLSGKLTIRVNATHGVLNHWTCGNYWGILCMSCCIDLIMVYHYCGNVAQATVLCKWKAYTRPQQRHNYHQLIVISTHWVPVTHICATKLNHHCSR